MTRVVFDVIHPMLYLYINSKQGCESLYFTYLLIKTITNLNIMKQIAIQVGVDTKDTDILFLEKKLLEGYKVVRTNEFKHTPTSIQSVIYILEKEDNKAIPSLDKLVPEIANQLDKPTPPYKYGDRATKLREWRIIEVVEALKELNYLDE